MKPYREPDWEALYRAEFQTGRGGRDEPIAAKDTGMVFPNQHILALFVNEDDGLTALGRHLTEIGEGGPVMTPDGMRFILRDREKSRGYWENRARIFAMEKARAEAEVDEVEEPPARQYESEPPRSGCHEDLDGEESETECPQCRGAGLLDEEQTCPTCDGYGVLLVHG